MTVWKRKSGKVLRKSRFVHFCEAALLPALGAHLYGDAGLAGGFVVAVVVGCSWEIANKFMDGDHQYADIVDFLAFAVGATVSAVTAYMLP